MVGVVAVVLAAGVAGAGVVVVVAAAVIVLLPLPPPTPLPMSQYFPTPPLKVICLEDSHFTRYNQCECCHDKLKWQIVGFSKTL